MKNNFLKIAGFSVLVAVIFSSCAKLLNETPANTTTGDEAYSTPLGYTQALAKAYGAFALTSSTGPASSDVQGVDPGTSDFLRLFWNTQELSTDEAVCAWNDPGVPDFHNMNWSSGNVILLGLYTRSIYQITVCNDFIRNSAPSVVAGKGFAPADLATIQNYRAEARFLRAYQYWVLMDEFANPPFVTENDPVGSFIPPQISRANLYKYVVSELLSCDSAMVAPRQNQYGRADQAAAWALLARVYLNAGVYTGTPDWTDAITYATKVINAGYSLDANYRDLFLADNNISNPEMIMPIEYDGVNTQNYGGTTFIINSSCGGGAGTPASYGVPSGGWAGNRATPVFAKLFPTIDTTVDKRALFFGTDVPIASIATFTDGVPVAKFLNITSTGATPPGGGTYASTDFPLFRLAEQYLIYAEAVLQGGTGGDMNTALNYMNLLRERAYGNSSGNFSSIALSDIINERGRELWWECFRRTDLIRFNEFTSGSYLWDWKGGVPSGTGVAGYYSIYPIPSSDIQVNPNLTQNPNY